MRVRDDELDAAQTAPRQLAQKVEPEGLGLRRADRQAQYLAPAIVVNTNCDDHRDRDDTTVAARLQVGRVQPDIGPFALKGPVEEGRDLAVDLGTQTADLALGDAGHAHGLNQFVDRAGRDALDIGFLDHRRQRLFGHPARLEKPGEVAPLAQLWDAQFDRPGTGLPIAVAIPVAPGDPIGAAFAECRPGQALDLQLHQAMRGKADHLA